MEELLELSEKEIKYIQSVTFGSFNQTVELLELKILTKIREELLGREENIDTIKYLMNIEKEYKSAQLPPP